MLHRGGRPFADCGMIDSVALVNTVIQIVTVGAR